jgi:hypothetical protein
VNDSRFAITAAFQVGPSGPTFEANAFRAQASGCWFFDPNNGSSSKVLNGCVEPFELYWVRRRLDQRAGRNRRDRHAAVGARTYTNPLGTPFLPIRIRRVRDVSVRPGSNFSPAARLNDADAALTQPVFGI